MRYLKKMVCSIFFLVSTGLVAKEYGPSYKHLNFGVVVNNDNYTIYRSQALGEKGLEKLQKYLEKNDLPFPTYAFCK